MSEEPVKKPKNGRVKRMSAYAGALATAAVAAYGAVKSEPEAKKAQAQIAASYKALGSQVERLQHWAHANRRRAQAAEASCKAEVASLQAYTSGFLLGQSKGQPRRSGARSRAVNGDQGAAAVKALVKALRTREAAARARSAAKALPKLAPPAADVRQLLKRRRKSAR